MNVGTNGVDLPFGTFRNLRQSMLKCVKQHVEYGRFLLVPPSCQSRSVFTSQFCCVLQCVMTCAPLNMQTTWYPLQVPPTISVHSILFYDTGNHVSSRASPWERVERLLSPEETEGAPGPNLAKALAKLCGNLRFRKKVGSSISHGQWISVVTMILAVRMRIYSI